MAARTHKLLPWCHSKIAILCLVATTAICSISNVRSETASIYDLDKEINFNALDRVEYNPETKQFLLFGHIDQSYEKDHRSLIPRLPYLDVLHSQTTKIPYLQYLATLLDNSSPEFSLDWTKESYPKIADWFRRLDSDSEWKELVKEWGNWIDDLGKVSATGRIFLPMFGIQPRDSGDANATDPWQKMDRYQLLSAVFNAAGNKEAGNIIEEFGKLTKQSQEPTNDYIKLLTVTGVLDEFNRASDMVKQGQSTKEQALVQTYGAFFQNLDHTFSLNDKPTEGVFRESLRQGNLAGAAMEAGLLEFDHRLPDAFKVAQTKLYESKAEIHVPVEPITPRLHNLIHVEPTFYGVDRNSMLAKAMFEADYIFKQLTNMPELGERIPSYQTEFMFDRNNPDESWRSPVRAQEHRLWVSIDAIDAAQSPDGNVIVIHDAKMRINVRDLDMTTHKDKNLVSKQTAEYEKLLTSLYNDFAREFPSVFHSLREAAKLTYVAQWLKAKNPKLEMPKIGRLKWNVPREIPGVITVAFTLQPPRPGAPALATYAGGGISLRPPPIGKIRCVIGCEDLPTDSNLKAVRSLPSLPPSVLNSDGIELNPSKDEWRGCTGNGGILARSNGSDTCGHPTIAANPIITSIQPAAPSPSSSAPSSTTKPPTSIQDTSLDPTLEKIVGDGGQLLNLIPYFVPIGADQFVNQLSCPQGFKKVGETFYGGTKCAPVGNGGNNPTPARSATDDCAARSSTAFFGIPGNPDPAAVMRDCEGALRDAPANTAGPPAPPPAAIVAAAPPPPPPPRTPLQRTIIPQPEIDPHNMTVDELQKIVDEINRLRKSECPPGWTPSFLCSEELRNDQYYIWGRMALHRGASWEQRWWGIYGLSNQIGKTYRYNAVRRGLPDPAWCDEQTTSAYLQPFCLLVGELRKPESPPGGMQFWWQGLGDGIRNNPVPEHFQKYLRGGGEARPPQGIRSLEESNKVSPRQE